MSDRRIGPLPLPTRRGRSLPISRFKTVRGVYFAGFSCYMKIGWSETVGRRLSEMQTAVPEKLRLYLVLRDVDPAREGELHRQFAELRLRGEWFKLLPPLTDFIKENRNQPATIWDEDELYRNPWDDRCGFK